MGGIGSGRYLRRGSKSRYWVADRQVERLDVRELYKDGFLSGEARGTITWFRNAMEVGSISTRFDPCLLLLRLGYSVGNPPVVVQEAIELTFTACYFGGDRPWFLCPACGRRCAVLWGRQRFLCRICQGVAYARQNESASSRAARRLNEIRAHLGVDWTRPLWRIFRPRYMRREQYRSLILELKHYEMVRTTFVLGLLSDQRCLAEKMGYLE